MVSHLIRDVDWRVVCVELNVEFFEIDIVSSVFNFLNLITFFILRVLIVKEFLGILVLLGLVILRQIQIYQVTENLNQI